MRRVVTWLGLVLAVSAFMPREVAAQAGVLDPASTVVRPGVGKLAQNYPNPFNPETWFPFVVGDAPACTEPGRQYRVSLRVVNLLAREVAVPELQRGTGTVAGGQALNGVMLPCGEYTAYWDGKDKRTGREAPSGIYTYLLQIDNQRPLVKKMSVVN
jgi:hypothetical protein